MPTLPRRILAGLVVSCLVADPTLVSAFSIMPFANRADNLEIALNEQALIPQLVEAFRQPFDDLAAGLIRIRPHLQPTEGFLDYIRSDRKPNRFGWDSYRPYRSWKDLFLFSKNELEESSGGERTILTNEAFQPVTDKLVRFADYSLQLPDYMLPLLDVRLWRDEAGQRVYAVTGRGRSRREFTRLEFRVRHIPDLRLQLELDKNELRMTFLNHTILTHEVVRWDLAPGQARTLRQFHLARHFMDATFGIPLEAGQARAKAVRDWLLTLEQDGRASKRDGLGDVGLGSGHGYLEVPHEIVRGAARVRVISEWGQNSRYLMLQDLFNLDHFLIFETDPEGRTFDVASGAEIPGRYHQSRHSYNPIDFGPGRTFFQHMSRALNVTRKRAGVTTGTRLRQNQSICELGLPLHGEYTVIKVENSTSLTPTGGAGAGLRRGEPIKFDSETLISYPLLLAYPAIEAPEPLTSAIMETVHQNDQRYISFPISETAPPFLGYAIGPDYAYWKRLDGTMMLEGKERVVYRRLSSEEDHVILQAQMSSDDTFIISDVKWVVGPQKGLPVQFSHRINMLMLVAKYGGGHLISLSKKVRDTFERSRYASPDGPQLVPQVVIKENRPLVIPGARQIVGSLIPLEEAAARERTQLIETIPTRSFRERLLGAA